MTKEGRIIIFIIVGSILLLGGLAYLATRSSSGSASGGDVYVSKNPSQNLDASPSGSISMGKIRYAGGNVSGTFEVKNTSDKSIKLRKIVTSCMCTKAKFEANGRESKFYAMEMNGDLNPLIDYDLPAGATGKLTYVFDPAAHGPAGIGPIDRVVTLYFDSGYKEFKFNGEVVK